jgi:hypothetical protein
MNDLQPLVIKLNVAKSKQLNESFISTFGSVVKFLLGYMFGDAKAPVSVKEENNAPLSDLRLKIIGSPSQVDSFVKALTLEKNYMQTYMELGLQDPETLDARHALNRAVEEFEKETEIRWPFQN